MKFKSIAGAKNNQTIFSNSRGISHELVDEIEGKAKKFGFSDIRTFNVEKIIIQDWVNLKCRYGCASFGTSWCCPPATPNPKEARKIISEYTTALLLVGHHKRSDFYLNNRKKREESVRYWKGIVSIERHLFLAGYYKAFALVSTNCSLCKQCTYPDQCRFPQEKRPMIESFSIDLIETVRQLGLISHVAIDSEDAVNDYGLILLE
jgi:predicted metal-binding protein